MPYSILIADDSALIRQAVKMALELCRFPASEVHTANDGRQAMEVLRREFVDLVFLDLNMPLKDGFEVLTEIRGSKEWKRLPVIVVSTEVNRESALLRDKGIQDFIAKPFKPEAICQAAFTALGRKAES